MTDVASKADRRRGRPPGPDHPPGPPGLRQPEPAHRRRPRPGDAGELPVPREDQPLRPRAHPRARRPRPRRHRVRLLRGLRHRRRRADRRRTPAPSCSRRRASAPTLAVRFSTVAGGRDSSEVARDPRGFAVKFYTEDGNWDLVGNNLGVFFIRDAIKFPDFIHSQKPDPVTFERQVAEPRLRLHQPDARGDAHGHAGVQPARHPGELPARSRASASTPTSGSTPQGETKLVKYHWLPKQGVKSCTAGRRRGDPGARTSATHTKDLYDAIDARRLPRVGAARADHGRRRAPRARLRPARRHQGVAGGRASRCARSARMVLEPRRRRTSSPRTSRSRSAPACSSTASTSPTTRCWSAARSPTPTPSATASARTTCSCRSTRRRTPGRHQPARRPDGLRRRPRRGPEPARQLRAVDPRRPARGASTRPTTSRAR